MSKPKIKKTYSKEYTTIQKQQHQIRELKRDKKQLENAVKQLQQQLHSKKDLEDLVDRQAKETKNWYDKRISDKKKENWLCHECGRDYLRMVIINRADGPHYFRRCGSKLCTNKTKLKKYTPLVKGLMEEGSEILS